MLETLKEQAFEAVIESHLLANGYSMVDRDGFDRERAIFPEIEKATQCLANLNQCSFGRIIVNC